MKGRYSVFPRIAVPSWFHVAQTQLPHVECVSERGRGGGVGPVKAGGRRCEA